MSMIIAGKATGADEKNSSRTIYKFSFNKDI